MPGRLLLVDDDRFILNPLARLFGLNGYQCTLAVSAEEAWRHLEADPGFDAVLLDIGLPDVDGLSLLRRIRARHRMPIIMLTARDSSADVVVSLEVGADDYVTKPFDPPSLVARVRAQVRRFREYADEAEGQRSIAVENLVLDLDAHDAFVDGQPAGLTPREFELLSTLVRNRGRALSRDTLVQQIWGYEPPPQDKTLAVHVRRLRQKIEADPDNPSLLLTVRGFGYKLAPAAA
jgi:DNA-binding response OmpR family regulator